MAMCFSEGCAPEYREGVIIQISPIENNDEGSNIVICIEEQDGNMSHILPVSDYYNDRNGYTRHCAITVGMLANNIAIGDIIRIPNKRNGYKYRTFEIQKLKRFTTEKPTKPIIPSTPIQTKDFPDYEVLTVDSNVFALSLKDKKVKIYGDKEKIKAHIEQFGLELEVVRKYIQKDEISSKALFRRLKNAGFVKVVKYRAKSNEDLILTDNFLILGE